MTILRIASDLHLEGHTGRPAGRLADIFLPQDDRDAGAVLILAGDICSQPVLLVEFLAAVMPRFKNTIFVPGNHELYRHNYTEWCDVMQRSLSASCPGLLFAIDDAECFKVDDTRFICATLWGDGGPTLKDQATTGYSLNDFRLVSISDEDIVRRFTVEDMMHVHQRQKATIAKHLAEPFSGKTVVVTHHLPSRRLVSPRFLSRDGSDGANGGFVGACDDLLMSKDAPSIWIHGHTHDSIDRMLERTRIICNPAGYRGEWGTRFNDFMHDKDGALEVTPKFVEV
jgi:Calcineurin-like phosphoesterase